MSSSELTATNSAFEKIGGKYALTFPVAIISLIWASFISVGFDGTRFNTSRTGWFVSALIAHLILILLAIPFRIKFLPFKNRISKPWTALAAFALLGVIRSTLMGEFAVYFGLAPSREYGYRQLTGLVSITTGLAVTVILVASVAERQQKLKTLIEERRRLTSIKTQAEELFAANQIELNSIIENSIKPSLEEIKNRLSTTDSTDEKMLNQAGQLITHLINERLRPISESLHRPMSLLFGENDRFLSIGPKVKRTTRVSVQALINPYLVTMVMVATTIAASIYYAGFTAVPIAGFIYLPFLIIALFVRAVTPQRWRIKIGFALPISIIGHIIAAIPSFLIIIWLGNYYENIAEQLPVAIIGFSFISAVITLLRAMESEQILFETEFALANNEAQNILNNLNQRIWLARRNTAQLLHGSVQAALTAANVRLKMGEITSADIEKVRNDIQRAINSLSLEERLELDIESEIEDLIDLWDGVCQIDVTISPQVVNTLNADLVAANCVNEFLKESVNNAIKHGQATEIEVKISQPDNGVLLAEVENNGQYQLENQAGLGTRIFDEVTTSWTRTRTETGTLVTGQIALMAKEMAEISHSN